MTIGGVTNLETIISRLSAKAFFVAVFAFWGELAVAQVPPLEITSIDWAPISGDPAVLTVHGDYFDNGDPPTVTLNGIELTVDSYDKFEILAHLETDEANFFKALIPEDGTDSIDFTLKVQTGSTSGHQGRFCFYIVVESSVEEIVEDECLGTGVAIGYGHTKREVAWRVWQGAVNPNNPQGVDTAVLSYKYGPTSLNDPKNIFGDPAFLQLTEDYEFDLSDFLGDYHDTGSGWPKKCFNLQNVFRGILNGQHYEWLERPRPSAHKYITIDDGMLTITKGYRWDGPSMASPINFLFVKKDGRVFPNASSLMRSTLIHDVMYDLLRFESGVSPTQIEDRTNFRALADCLYYMFSRQDYATEAFAVFTYAVLDKGGKAKSEESMSNYPWKFHAIADAGGDQTNACAPPTGTEITLDGSASVEASKYIWKVNGIEEYAGPSPTLGITLPTGVHTAELIVDDGNDDDEHPLFRDSEEVTITVIRDTAPPLLSMIPHPIVVTPPDHRYASYAVKDYVVSLSDDCASALTSDDVVISHVTSDEAEDASGGGDGATSDDIVISADGKSVMLRRERLKAGNGRVYTIHVQVVDDAGNAGAASFQVHVPSGKTAFAVDDGPAYTAVH